MFSSAAEGASGGATEAKPEAKDGAANGVGTQHIQLAKGAALAASFPFEEKSSIPDGAHGAPSATSTGVRAPGSATSTGASSSTTSAGAPGWATSTGTPDGTPGSATLNGAPSPPEPANDNKRRGGGGEGEGRGFGGLGWTATTASATLAAVLLSAVMILVNSEFVRARAEVEAIRAAQVHPPTAERFGAYVRRPELEEALASFMHEPADTAGTYMVVFGARGSGKTTVVNEVLSKMDGGVLVVPLGETSSRTSDLGALIVQAALDQYNPPTGSPYATSEPIKGGNFAERLRAAAKARGEPGWRPTIVLDMNLSGDGALIRAACALLKLLAHDEPLCHAIIVLSNSFAVAELPPDPARQTFLRVGAFLRDEAAASLDAHFRVPLAAGVATAAAVAAVKARVLPLTTLPSRMAEVGKAVLGSKDEAEFAARAEAWASGFEAAAREEVAASQSDTLNVFLRGTDGKEYGLFTRDLMRALLDAGGPVKLPSAGYKVPAKVFASKIRESDEAKATFDLDLAAKTVDFASGAHRQAAAELLPPSPPPSPSGLLGWLFGGQA